MSDNNNPEKGTVQNGGDIIETPTTVDTVEVIENNEVDMIPKTDLDNWRKMDDARYNSTINIISNVAKENPDILKNLSGDDETLKKIRNSVVKKAFPEYNSFEEAQEYLSTIEDKKTIVDKNINTDLEKVNIYLDALGEVNTDLKQESTRLSFIDNFHSLNKELPINERLAKAKILSNISISTVGTVNNNNNIPPVTPIVDVQPKPKSDEEKIKEQMDHYNSMKKYIVS